MRTIRAAGPARKRVALTIALLAMSLIASGCFYHPGAVQHEQNDPTTRPWWCMSTGNGGHHVEPHYDGQTKGMLSWQDCKATSAAFDWAIAYASQWPTLGDAEADGFHRIAPYVEGMGTHHVRLGDFDPQQFDPNNPEFPGTELDENFHGGQPEFLMYDGHSADSELVGFAWFVKTDDTTPPEGFAGGNDWWHRHPTLCFNNQIQIIRDGPCVGSGIDVDFSEWWMVHAWIVDGWNTKADVFTNHHPCLLPGGPADHGHACWDEANNGGGHGGH